MIRYAGPFLLLASIPVFFYAVGPAGPFATIIALLCALVGADYLSPRGHVLKGNTAHLWFRLLPRLYIPLQLCVIVWAIDAAARTSTAGVVSLILSVGLTTGVFGMLAAHEMVHSKSKLEHTLGTAMLSGMTYRHFRIAHVHGHHRWAATPRDSATFGNRAPW
jgi:alkane 1-monooxygenase